MKKIFAILIFLSAINCSKKDKLKDPSATSIQLQSPTALNTNANLIWSVLNNEGFGGYKILRKVRGSSQFTTLATITDAKINNFTDVDVPYGVTFLYQIVSVLNNGSKIESNIQTFYSERQNIVLEKQVQTIDSVSISWTKAKHPTFLEYTIYRKEGTGLWEPKIVINDRNNNRFVDKWLPQGESVSYKVIVNFREGVPEESNSLDISLPATKLELLPLIIEGNSVILNWTPISYNKMSSYRVNRRTSSTDYGKEIAYIESGKPPTFTDKDVPYTSYISYEIVVIFNDFSVMKSNQQQYLRNDIITLNMTPFDAKYDKEKKLLYFFESEGRINQFDITTNTIKRTLNSFSTIGYCDLGIHNGVKELYVSRNDGWVFIYNAETFQKVGQVSLMVDVSSVCYANGKLFVSTKGPFESLLVVDRNTLAVVNNVNKGSAARLVVLPGTNTELVALNSGMNSTSLDYLSFDAIGNVLANTSAIMRYFFVGLTKAFPAGDKFITSDASVFKKNLVYETSLPPKDTYNAFEFDVARGELLAGTGRKTIESFTIQGLTQIKSRVVKNNPAFIFRDDNQIINVGNGYVSNITIEYIQ